MTRHDHRTQPAPTPQPTCGIRDREPALSHSLPETYDPSRPAETLWPLVKHLEDGMIELTYGSTALHSHLPSHVPPPHPQESKAYDDSNFASSMQETTMISQS